MNERSDGQLLTTWSHGDVEAFEALVDRHQTALLRHAHSMLGDRGGVEDVVQETFLRLAQKPPVIPDSAKGNPESERAVQVALDHLMQDRTVLVIAHRLATIRNADRMLLVVAPSGTRKRTERWKSGFYHIARAADVPLVCGILDYGRKEAAFGPKIVLTGDVKTDMDAIRAAYAGKTGMRPDQMTPIRIKEEAEEEAG